MKGLNLMTKGWHKEPTRHALASKGIRTSHGRSKYRDMKEELSKELDEYVDIKPPIELRREINWDELKEKVEKGNPLENDYYEALNITYPKKEIIYLFWWCNHNDAWEWFDFKTTAEIFRAEILWWLFQEVSFLSKYPDKNVYLEIEEKGIDWVFGVETHKSKPPTDMFSDKPIVPKSEWKLGENITKFQPAIEEYVELYKKLDSHDFDKSKLEKNIALIDRTINIEHNHGTALLFRTSIPEVRKEFEERYL